MVIKPAILDILESCVLNVIGKNLKIIIKKEGSYLKNGN